MSAMPIMGAISGVLGDVGNRLQAVETNRAGRKARDYYAGQTGQGSQRLGDLAYGGGAWGNSVMSSLAAQQGDWAGSKKYADLFNNQIGGSLTDQSNQLIDRSGGQDIRNNFGSASNYLTGLSEMQRRYLNDSYAGGTNQLMGSMGVGDRGLLSAYDQGARGVQQAADQFGAGREAVINRDAQKSSKATDRATSARLAASGFGGSTAGLQMRAGNARSVEDARQGQLQNLHDQQSAARLGTSKDLLAGRTGLMTGQQNLQNQALSGRIYGQNSLDESQLNNYLGRMYDRSTQDTQLQENSLTRELQARQAKIGMLSNTAQSSAMNPQLNQNTLGYYPGVSSWGQGMISSSNSLASMSSMGGGGGGQQQQAGNLGGSSGGFRNWGGQMNQMQMMG